MGYGYIVTAGQDYHNSWILNCSRTRIAPIRMPDVGADVAMSENPVRFEMIIAARVERARVAYRPSNKRSKVAAAESEKRVAAEIGGTVCEWDVPFDVRCGNNVFDVKTIQENQ
jgi:hypothetical protein